jgi:hypothetical protein
VSIETAIPENEWNNLNAIRAMKEALAISAGVSIDSIDVNYASPLCRDPNSRRVLRKELMPMSSLVPSHQNSTVSLLYDTMSSKTSIVHIAAQSHLEFSYRIQLFG